MQIVAIAGRKQSGKNTVGNLLVGYQLKKHHQIKDYRILDDGSLNILTDFDGNEDWGILDLQRKDQEFIIAAENTIWPFAKLYSFADQLKTVAVKLFGIKPEQVWGTDEEKNTLIDLKWEDMPGNVKISTDYTESTNTPYSCLEPKKFGNMTAREFLQYFGTDICRKIYSNVWIQATMNQILAEQSDLAIITDARFPDEVDAVNKANGITARLKRNIFNDQHSSETALDNYDESNFKIVIDNQDCSVQDMCNMVLKEFKGKL